jgi:MFS family permease
MTTMRAEICGLKDGYPVSVTHRPQVITIRAAAVLQGLALVVVPTISTVLTDPNGFDQSAAAYGTLFVPQSILAVLSSFAGAMMTRRFGARATLLTGFAANAAAMALMAASAVLESRHTAAYIVLLCATSCLGIGFALVTPTLNVLAGALEPDARDRAVLIVNALLGGSAAAAPLLLIVFVGLGFWWGLPVACALGMLALIAIGTRVPFGPFGTVATNAKPRLPIRVVLFAGFAFAYGLCEQLNGSWAPIYMTKHLGGSAADGSVALAFFWAVATGFRVVFAAVGRTIAPSVVFCALPFVLAGAFGMLALLPAHTMPSLGIGAFALAGLGISALLPLVLSFCEQSISAAASSATGIVFAVYLVGYGIAAFGVGPLQHQGITLPAMDGAAVGLAFVVAALAFIIVKTTGEHP